MSSPLAVPSTATEIRLIPVVDGRSGEEVRILGWRDALRKALCFGTKRDVFSLGVITGRGQLPPRKNGASKVEQDVGHKRTEFVVLRAIAGRRGAFA